MSEHEIDANEFLMGGGKVPSVSWRNKPAGTEVSGIVARPSRVLDQRSVDDGSILYWDEAKTRPKKMICVYLDTGYTDPETPDHDGVWAWYVKGKSATDALRNAIRQSGRAGLEVGGAVTVRYVGEGKATNKAFNPPKLFDVTYTPPNDASASLLDDRQGSARQSTTAGHTSAVSTVASRQATVLRNAQDARSTRAATDEPPF